MLTFFIKYFCRLYENDKLPFVFVFCCKSTSVEKGNMQTGILLVLAVVGNTSEMIESKVRDLYDPTTVQ